jgi:hypothetical protein
MVDKAILSRRKTCASWIKVQTTLHAVARRGAESFAVVYPTSPRGDMGLVVGRREELMNSGCQTSHGGAKVTGQDIILNYPVTVVQQPHRAGMEMVTLWMAPELSCFALRATIHAKQPDGTWKLISEKRALKVTVNR